MKTRDNSDAINVALLAKHVRNAGAQHQRDKIVRYLRKQHAENLANSTDTYTTKGGKKRTRVNLLYTGRTDMCADALAELGEEVKRAGHRKGGEGRR